MINTYFLLESKNNNLVSINIIWNTELKTISVIISGDFNSYDDQWQKVKSTFYNIFQKDIDEMEYDPFEALTVNPEWYHFYYHPTDETGRHAEYYFEYE